MSEDQDPAAASRWLAYVLRHRPQAAGLELDGAGWVDVETLLAAAARAGRPISPQLLERVVAGLDKRRFELVDGRIRASQGHSVPVDLGLQPLPPPAVLYHGTVARFLPAIRAQGLVRGRRQHVHLSDEVEKARQVGARRGTPVVLAVDAAGMSAAGHAFYRSANGVWLTAAVPPDHLRALPSSP